MYSKEQIGEFSKRKCPHSNGNRQRYSPTFPERETPFDNPETNGHNGKKNGNGKNGHTTTMEHFKTYEVIARPIDTENMPKRCRFQNRFPDQLNPDPYPCKGEIVRHPVNGAPLAQAHPNKIIDVCEAHRDFIVSHPGHRDCVFHNNGLVKSDPHPCSGIMTDHHILYQREGGTDDSGNKVPMCRNHQDIIHSREVWGEEDFSDLTLDNSGK